MLDRDARRIGDELEDDGEPGGECLKEPADGGEVMLHWIPNRRQVGRRMPPPCADGQ